MWEQGAPSSPQLLAQPPEQLLAQAEQVLADLTAVPDASLALGDPWLGPLAALRLALQQVVYPKSRLLGVPEKVLSPAQALQAEVLLELLERQLERYFGRRPRSVRTRQQQAAPQ